MSGWQLLDAYLDDLTARGYQPTSVLSKRLWIIRFRRFCHERFGLKDAAAVTAAHAEQYQQALRWELGRHGKLLSQNTVGYATAQVRCFYRWAVRRCLLLVNPFEDTVLPRLPIVPRRLLSVAEVEILLSGPDLLKPTGLRDRALLETMYSAGLRRAECQRLNVEDAQLSDLVLIVRGKGSVTRHQPIGPMLAATLAMYLRDARPQLSCNSSEPAFFIGEWGKRLVPGSINALVSRYGRQTGLGKVSPHLLRHAYGSHLLANGATLEEVQRLLGHQLIGSTQTYTHITQEQLAQGHRRAHPRARRRRPPTAP